MSLPLNSRTRTLAAVAVAALLAACAAPGPQAERRAALTPAALGATGTGTPWPAERWWAGWNDAQLDALVERALAGQPSLQTAQARVRQAQAAADAAGAARSPQVNLSADLSDQRFTENGLYPAPLAGATRWNNDARLSASWELDLFGRQRAALDAAIGSLKAAEADQQAARVLLAGNVAAGWFGLGRLVENRRIAAESLDQRQRLLALVQQRVGAGLDSQVELRQAQGLVAQTEVDLHNLDEQIAHSRHALAELSGQGPNALDGVSPALAAVHSAALPTELPADLLGRRADLVAQRWRVDAATQGVAEARAEFYPNLNLVGFVGLSSLGLDRFLSAGSRQAGIGPALRLPILEGGRLRAQLAARSAEADAAVDGYNATLLRALREVADEVSTLQALERQQRAQDDATAAAEAAADLALQRYRAGLGNFLTVLTAQTNVLAQRRAAADLKARHLLGEAALARALGGGWTEA